MNTYTKQLIKIFDTLSKTYQNAFTHDQKEQVKLESLINSWQLKKGSTVLEVGGGTGDLSPFIINKIGEGGKLDFLDISSQMIAIAKQKLSIYKQISFYRENIEEYKPNILYDSIVIFNTLPHFENKLKAFQNCFKLLKPNGKLIISHNNSRWSIVGCHKQESVENNLSNFPTDEKVYKDLISAGFKIETFENNEGYDYYLVICAR